MLVTEPDPRLVDIVAAAVEGGVDIVQWRDTTSHIAEVSGLAASIAEATRAPAILLANVRPPTAFALRNGFRKRIDGIHFPEGHADGRFKLTRRAGERIEEILITHRTPDCGITGESIHSVDAARRAEEAGADYVVAGTIFESNSHPDRPGAGLEFLRNVCEVVSIPVIAIGGITTANAPDCIRAGAAGVAVLSPIMRAENPKSVATAYRGVLDSI
jgi:thiamine-phosphate diphosphorylase